MSDQNQAASLQHTYSLVTHTIQTLPPSISFINLVSGLDSAVSSSSFFFLSSSPRSNLTLFVDFSLFPVHFFELLHRIFHCVGISGNIWRKLSKIGEEDTTTMLRCTLHRQLKLSQAQKRRKQLMQGPDTTRTRQGKTPIMQHVEKNRLCVHKCAIQVVAKLPEQFFSVKSTHGLEILVSTAQGSSHSLEHPREEEHIVTSFGPKSYPSAGRIDCFLRCTSWPRRPPRARPSCRTAGPCRMANRQD